MIILATHALTFTIFPDNTVGLIRLELDDAISVLSRKVVKVKAWVRFLIFDKNEIFFDLSSDDLPNPLYDMPVLWGKTFKIK